MTLERSLTLADLEEDLSRAPGVRDRTAPLLGTRRTVPIRESAPAENPFEPHTGLRARAFPGDAAGSTSITESPRTLVHARCERLSSGAAPRTRTNRPPAGVQERP